MKKPGENKFALSYPDYKNFKGILDNTFVQTKEFIDPINFFLPTSEKVIKFDTELFLDKLFQGRIVYLPLFKIIEPAIEKYDKFENFTKKDEVNNFALWVLAALRYLSLSANQRLGKELEIIQFQNPRDGRLDVVAIKNSNSLIIETKTDLRSALVENRFLYQIPNYERECSKLTKDKGDGGESLVLLGLGGVETDLFPSDHPDCTTGNVGGISEIFYHKILERKIRYVSANALWCLVAYVSISGKRCDLFDFVFSVFADRNAIGLLSAGIVMREGETVSIKPIDRKAL